MKKLLKNRNYCNSMTCINSSAEVESLHGIEKQARKVLIALFMITLLFSCSHEKYNVFNGKIDGLEVGDKIVLYVEDINGSSWIAADSTVVTKANEFTFKTKVSDCPIRLSYLKSGGTNKSDEAVQTHCFLESYADLNITGNTKEGRHKVTGGLYSYPDMSEINRITDSAQNLQDEAMKMLSKSNETNDSVLRQTAFDLVHKSNDIYRSLDSFEETFVKNNPDIAYSATLLRYDYNLMRKIDDYEKAFYTLSERVQNSPAGLFVKNYIVNFRSSEVGASAPDFSLKALDGQEITLSNFKGKYVLIDFWGSWCGPCRQSSPSLVELYNDLKKNEANIEFIGIACNEPNDETWIKAVNEDNLTWIQLNDSHSEKGKSIKKRYAILGVPTSILISPEGKILYRDHPLTIIPEVKSTVLN